MIYGLIISPCGNPCFRIQRVHWNVEIGMHGMIGLDHIVLGIGGKSMLGAKNFDESVPKNLFEPQRGMLKISIYRGIMTQQRHIALKLGLKCIVLQQNIQTCHYFFHGRSFIFVEKKPSQIPDLAWILKLKTNQSFY